MSDQSIHICRGCSSCIDDKSAVFLGDHGPADPAHKVYKLLEFAQSSDDIADPWYTGNFDRTYEDVVKGCRGLLKKLVEEKREAMV